MQQPEEYGSIIEIEVPETEGQEGRFCETTRRVVIISPYPGSVRSLFVALTIRCYDVLVFHHDHDPVLQSLDSDLIIIDRTMNDQAAANAPVPEIGGITGRKPPVLYLYKEGQNEIFRDKDSLLWPSPLDKAIHKIEEIVTRNNFSPSNPGTDLLRIKDVVMDLKRITVRNKGIKVELTKTEFDLLKALLLNGGGVMTRQELMSFVWGDSYFGGSNSVDVHIKALRHKLGDDPKNPKYIATVRGIGYRIAD